MKLDQLVFVALNGYALALDRDTGQIVVWSNNEMTGGYSTLLLDGDCLIASTHGYIYRLDALTGEIIWHNPLKGYPSGVASLLSARGQSSQAAFIALAMIDETSKGGGGGA